MGSIVEADQSNQCSWGKQQMAWKRGVRTHCCISTRDNKEENKLSKKGSFNFRPGAYWSDAEIQSRKQLFQKRSPWLRTESKGKRLASIPSTFWPLSTKLRVALECNWVCPLIQRKGHSYWPFDFHLFYSKERKIRVGKIEKGVLYGTPFTLFSKLLGLFLAPHSGLRSPIPNKPMH